MPILAGFAAIVALAAAAPDPELALKAKAEACIRDNAAAVERNQPDLSTAAEFLVQYLCADELRIYGTYRANSKLLTSWRQGDSALFGGSDEPVARTRTGRQRRETESVRRQSVYDSVTVDPQTGELIWPAGRPTAPNSEVTEIIVTGQINGPVLDEFRAIAGRAVLAARLQRQKP